MIKTVIFDIGNVLMHFDYMPYVRNLLKDERLVDIVNGAIWRTGYWNELDRGESVEKIFPLMLAAAPGYEEVVRLTFENIGRGIFSCYVHLVKPDPRIYQRICDEYHLKPEECIFIDDNEENIISANEFGLNAIRFTGYPETREKADKLLEDKGELIQLTESKTFKSRSIRP